VFTANCNAEIQYANMICDINVHVQELLILILNDGVDIEFHCYLECTINLQSHNLYVTILPILVQVAEAVHYS